jgi:hypothetical protein
VDALHPRASSTVSAAMTDLPQRFDGFLKYWFYYIIFLFLLFGSGIVGRTCIEAGEVALRTFHLPTTVGTEVESRVGMTSTIFANSVLIIITYSAKTFAHNTTGDGYALLLYLVYP